jgi:hypothetical protein
MSQHYDSAFSGMHDYIGTGRSDEQVGICHGITIE